MFVNKDKVRQLMVEKADNNYHEFARQLDMDVAQIHRLLNTPAKAGPKFLGRFMKYCQKHGLNFHDYIFLEESLHGCNSVSACESK